MKNYSTATSTMYIYITKYYKILSSLTNYMSTNIYICNLRYVTERPLYKNCFEIS